MKVPWRVTLLVSVLVVVFVATIPPAMAKGGPGGGGGLPPAGTYDTRTMFAGFSVNQPYPSPQINISVNRVTNVSKPSGSSSTTSAETDVSVSIQDYVNSVFGGGCFILAHPADFNLAGDLSSASLKTTITSTTPTCFGSGSLPYPYSIDISWKGSGPIAVFQDQSNYQCLTYKSETDFTNRGNNASASATLTGFGSPLTAALTGIGINEQRVQAEGTAQSTCTPSGTKGAGQGPLSAGSYRFAGPSVNASFGSYPGPLVFIAVNDITQESHPQGGPATLKHEIDLNVQMFGGATKDSGCWVISPSDFTSNGVNTASLKTSITNSTATCPGPGPSGITLPLTVQATWSGTGPVVTLRDENVFKCLGFSQETRSVVQSNNGNATATLTAQQSTTALTGGQASLTTGDQHVHVQGVDPQPCIARG